MTELLDMARQQDPFTLIRVMGVGLVVLMVVARTLAEPKGYGR